MSLHFKKQKEDPEAIPRRARDPKGQQVAYGARATGQVLLQRGLDRKKFQKRTEDFTCGYCGVAVQGSGFTNHCPKCLWSKHVDEWPGDRANICGGMMKPEKLLLVKGKYKILHQCVLCGAEKQNKAVPDDNLGVLLET